DEVVVDDGCRDVRKRGGGECGLKCGDRDLGCRSVDVVESGEDRSAALQLDEPGGLENEERASKVAGVVRHGDRRVRRDVFYRVVLRRVERERVDGGGADGGEVFAGRLV